MACYFRFENNTRLEIAQNTLAYAQKAYIIDSVFGIFKSPKQSLGDLLFLLHFLLLLLLF